MYDKMKKLYYIIFITILFGCVEPFENELPPIEISNELKMDAKVGIRLETPFVTDNVKMNVKTELEGKYFILIKDISNKVVSKEEITLKNGDNILDVHTRILPVAGYRIGLYTENGYEIGITDFNKLN